MNANANTMSISIDNVANKFESNTRHLYLGCEITIIRKQEPFKYVTTNGKQATKSARYWGFITFPDGTKEDFKSARGGAIARACGVWVRPEHEAKEKQGELYEVTNRRKDANLF